MDTNKSSDAVKSIIASVLRDVQTLRNDVITPRSLKLTTLKVFNRIDREGICFLTKTLPRLGKAFDNALHNDIPMDCTGFRKIPGTKLPRFLGELFQLVLSQDGKVLPTPCVTSIRQIGRSYICFTNMNFLTRQNKNRMSYPSLSKLRVKFDTTMKRLLKLLTCWGPPLIRVVILLTGNKKKR